MGRGRSEELDYRAALVWSHLLVNDVDGDAFEGVCAHWDDKVLVLVGGAGVPFRFFPRDGSGPRPFDAGQEQVIPAGRVKFSTVKAQGVGG